MGESVGFPETRHFFFFGLGYLWYFTLCCLKCVPFPFSVLCRMWHSLDCIGS